MMKNAKMQIWIKTKNESTKQSHRTFIHVDLALKVIMNRRTVESCDFKRNLGFTLHDVINTKEQ